MVNLEQAAPLPSVQPAVPMARRRWGEWLIEQLIRIAGISAILVIGLIFLFLFAKGCRPFFNFPAPAP